MLTAGRPQEARTLLLGALRIRQEAEDHEATLRAQSNLSFDDQWLDQLEGVHDKQGLELARRIGAHPISWQRSFEGGRVWYTAMGHAACSYSERPFLDHLLGGIEWVVGIP